MARAKDDPEKKYLLVPGPINSLYDGQIHQIGPNHLANCYQVPMDECVVYDPLRSQANRALYRSLIPLRPLYNGRYREWLRNFLTVRKRIESAILAVGEKALKNHHLVRQAIFDELAKCKAEGLIECGITESDHWDKHGQP